MRDKLTVSIWIFVAANIVLAVFLFGVKSGNRVQGSVARYVGNPTLPDVYVCDRAGQSFELRSTIAALAPVMVVLYTPSDCPTCFDEKYLWQRAAEKGGIKVIGIACSADPTEYWTWHDLTELPIDVYLDTSFAVLDSMRPVTTPIKLLFNQSGELVWVDPPRLEEHTIRNFMTDLKNAME